MISLSLKCTHNSPKVLEPLNRLFSFNIPLSIVKVKKYDLQNLRKWSDFHLNGFLCFFKIPGFLRDPRCQPCRQPHPWSERVYCLLSETYLTNTHQQLQIPGSLHFTSGSYIKKCNAKYVISGWGGVKSSPYLLTILMSAPCFSQYTHTHTHRLTPPLLCWLFAHRQHFL